MAVLRNLWGPRWRWLTITVLWLVVAILAFWGMTVGDPTMSVWDRLYAIPDFYSISISNSLAALDWRIQLARFLGPMVFASTFFAATAAVFREQWTRLRLRWTRDHVVVAGLGEKGSRLARSFHEAGRRVVAIELDPAAADAASLSRQGITVLAGRATDEATLAEAGVARASDLVIACDDATNAEVLSVAQGIARAAGRAPLRASVHLVDPQLSRLLRASELGTGTGDVRCDFFNVFQRGSRLWLAETDPFRERADGRPPHIVIVGVGRLGEGIAVSAAQEWAEHMDDGAEPLRLTIVDPEAGERFRAMRVRHPALVSCTQAEAIDYDADRPDPVAAVALDDLLGGGTVTTVFVCDEDDTLALSTALAVCHGLGSTEATVGVRTRSEDGLSLLLAQASAQTPTVTLRGFPLFDRTCSADAIDGGTNEAVARALHRDYLARAQADGTTGPTAVPWDDLDEDTRESNRRAADALLGSLAEVNCGLTPLYGWDGAGFAFTDDEVERLARREHERWVADKERAGWRHGDTRDDAAKRHPLLVGWSALDDLAQEQNRASQRDLVPMLARAGFQIVRRTPTGATAEA